MRSVEGFDTFVNQLSFCRRWNSLTPFHIHLPESTMNNSIDSLSNVSLNDSIASELNLSEQNTREQSDRDVVIHNLMQVYLCHKLTKNAVEDVAKLINNISGAKFNIPSTNHLIFSEFLRRSHHKVYKYIFCPKCNKYIQFPYNIAKDAKCSFCQKDLAPNEEFLQLFKLRINCVK